MASRHKLASADLLATGVVAGTYGDSTHSAHITVNEQGQLIAASAVAIAGGGGGSTDLVVHNATGGPLAAGTLVYLSSFNAVAQKFDVAPASAAQASTLAQYVVDATIADTADGTVKKFKLFTHGGGNVGVIGNPIFLSSSVPGTATNIMPSTATDTVQQVGYVSDTFGTQFAFQILDALVPQIGTAGLQDAAVTPTKEDLTLARQYTGAAPQLTLGTTGTTGAIFLNDSAANVVRVTVVPTLGSTFDAQFAAASGFFLVTSVAAGLGNVRSGNATITAGTNAITPIVVTGIPNDTPVIVSFKSLVGVIGMVPCTLVADVQGASLTISLVDAAGGTPVNAVADVVVNWAIISNV